MSDGLPVLWQYSFSNYNEKARWALEFKVIWHRRHSVMPGWPPEFPYELPEPLRWEFLEPMRDHPALGWIRETWQRHRGASAAV